MSKERGLVMTVTDTPAIGSAVALKCRECDTRYPLDASYACYECFGPLEVAYELGNVTREQIESGPNSMWRYEALLPVVPGADGRPGLQQLGVDVKRVHKEVPHGSHGGLQC
jgi:threonine synthase